MSFLMKIIDNEEASVIHFFRRLFNKIARDIFNFKTFSSLNVTFCVAITTVCVHYLPTVLLFKCKILLESLEELLQTLPLYFRIHYTSTSVIQSAYENGLQLLHNNVTCRIYSSQPGNFYQCMLKLLPDTIVAQTKAACCLLMSAIHQGPSSSHCQLFI